MLATMLRFGWWCLSVVMLNAFVCGVLQNYGSVMPQSPCPRFFQYQYDGREWVAYVMIPSVAFGTTIKLHIHMSIARALPTKYAGHIELMGPRSEVLQAILQERPIRYKVHFPLAYPLPALTALVLNDRLLCTGSKVQGPIVTNIALEHTLYPHGHNLNSRGPADRNSPPNFQEGDVLEVVQINPDSVAPVQPNFFDDDNNETPETTSRVSTALTTPPPFVSTQPPNNLVVYNERYSDVCGLSSGVSPLIANGDLVARGGYPWLVAIFEQRSLGLEFKCGSSLVSRLHVITAAHCIQYGDNTALAPADMLLLLGKHKIKKWTESGTLVREVAQVHLHPQYKTLHADADIAIIVMSEEVQFTRMVKPVCLWQWKSSLSELVDKEATIVGWGRDETGQRVTTEPRQTRVRVVSQEVCLRSHSDYRYITSNRTLCAGGQNGAGPCTGDSGGGLLVQRDNRWFLRGIISMSLAEKSTLSCDLNHYSVFVDMAKFVDWIIQYIT